jgi:hypothetical protein
MVTVTQELLTLKNGFTSLKNKEENFPKQSFGITRTKTRTVLFNLWYVYHQGRVCKDKLGGGSRKHLTSIRMKHRNCLNSEPALIPTLMKICPQTEVLANKKHLFLY